MLAKVNYLKGSGTARKTEPQKPSPEFIKDSVWVDEACWEGHPIF